MLSRFFSKKSLHAPAIIAALCILVLPNIIFLAVASYTGTTRPILNMDYCWLLLLLAIWLKFPKKPIFIITVACLILSSSIDSFQFIQQIFPFLNLESVLYLLPFLPTAPTTYIMLSAIFVVYLIVLPFVIIKITKRSTSESLIAVFTLGLITILTLNNRPLADKSKYVYSKSQANALWTHEAALQKEYSEIPTFTPYPIKPASAQLNPQQNRILMITAESLGSTKDEVLQKDIAKLLHKQAAEGKIKSFSTGHMPVDSSTVEGEMREVCHVKISSIQITRAPKSQYASCLPNQYAQKGLTTIGMHNADSAIYGRLYWYPKAGFQKTLFVDQLSKYKQCSLFDGACDYELTPEITRAFAQHDKLFFYWMTLNGHYPYQTTDIINHRFDCARYPSLTEEACHNLQLQAQLLDQIADINTRPEMKGVEVVIAGDHMPPFAQQDKAAEVFNMGHVTWYHYIIP